MTELLTALAIILMIFVAINVRYVFKLRSAKVRLEREVSRYADAAADLEHARKTEIDDARAAVHHLMRKLAFDEEDKTRADKSNIARLN